MTNNLVSIEVAEREARLDYVIPLISVLPKQTYINGQRVVDVDTLNPIV